ncbi:TIGR01212 family radical SAM protein [bacterium]|nr:TIGR01212 family radical SAM protein [bacterium]
MKTGSHQKRYRTFRQYLKQRYGVPVRKISIDASMTCPNRDGTIAVNGCIFCNNKAFHPFETVGQSIDSQIANQIMSFKDRGRGEKFIAYFQTYSNTYASVDRLREMLGHVRNFPDIVGIAIGTRPDCIDRDKLQLIASFASDYEVWIEYGLQSAHDETLKLINRGHSYADFIKAVQMTRQYPISICVHLILGLPGESQDDMLKTSGQIARLPIHAVKFHPLQVIRETALEAMYAEHRITVPDLESYVTWIVSCIERLPEPMIIQRLTADAAQSWLIAPDWCHDKADVLKRIDEEFERRDSCQGIYYKTETIDEYE